jgi:hypothetical protein
MKPSTPISEAKRYLANAKELLKEKAIKDGDYYTDSKYVSMAGDTAWKGVLIALEAVFGIKEIAKTNITEAKKIIDWCEQNIKS